MQSWEEFFAGKRVTIMGLGMLGRSIGDAAFVAQQGAHVTVTDTKTPEQLSDSVAQLKTYPNITFHLGGHTDSDFTDTDMVIKAAGVRLDSPYIAAAHEAGVPVYMSTALAAQWAKDIGVTIVGVTGTRGKSTTTHMIYRALKDAGKNVYIGGNVRGISTLALLPQIQAGDVLVLELDSWQLQGFGDLRISPDVAVFTNLLPDHQNYYSSMDEYFADKANIYRNQREGDVLIVGVDIAERICTDNPPTVPTMAHELPDEWTLSIPGEHNRHNAACAKAALEALAIDEMIIRSSLERFTGVEGRLQFVREVTGIKIYNDNNATTPDATIAALKALDTGTKSIILIAGGADKGLEMNTLLYEIAKTCKRVILLAGTGTDRIVPLMQDCSVFDSIESAVREAIASASSGDTILFSPAFASFGMFTNEYDRNDQFMHSVKSI